MNNIHIYISKVSDTIAFSFDGENAAAFILSYRTFYDNPTYEAAYIWFYDAESPYTGLLSQSILESKYVMLPLSDIHSITELYPSVGMITPLP